MMSDVHLWPRLLSYTRNEKLKWLSPYGGDMVPKVLNVSFCKIVTSWSKERCSICLLELSNFCWCGILQLGLWKGQEVWDLNWFHYMSQTGSDCIEVHERQGTISLSLSPSQQFYFGIVLCSPVIEPPPIVLITNGHYMNSLIVR